ncbi:MAG: hypothetical protein Q8Q36_01420, partial [bacterium]|nr:hypothetical protein [bacterium]
MSVSGLSRVHLLSLFIVLFAAALVSRLFFIQIVEGKEYEEAANRQYVTPSSQVFDRGTIFFREKGGDLVSAATLQSGYLVAVNPKEIKDAEAVYEALSRVIDIPRAEFMGKATKQDDPYEEVARRVSEESAEKLTALAKEGKLGGVSVYRERWRFYPAGSLAARVLGYVGYNNDDALAGRYGLERYYEGVLSREGEGLYVNFFAEMFSNLGDSIFRSAAREGDIVVTIEPTVERALHDELQKVMDEWRSDLAGGVIIDPMTGEIYAMEVLPGFNPNNMKALKDP